MDRSLKAQIQPELVSCDEQGGNLRLQLYEALVIHHQPTLGRGAQTGAWRNSKVQHVGALSDGMTEGMTAQATHASTT